MENKEIYIDGVDVSGCEFYLPYSEKCECIVDDNGNNNLFCREYRDCYYKRMYHTGQEKDIYKNENKELYKQLKAQLLDQEAETLKAGGIIETLTKENEQLKKQVCGLRPELKYIIDKTCCKYNINAKYYHEKIIEIINNLDKYKQTLTEIKEIAEKNLNIHTCAFKGCGYDLITKQILQKISEVEDV